MFTRMKRINVMRMLPPMASALVAHIYEKNLPVSLQVGRKDYTGMIPVIAKYEADYDEIFNRILTDIAHKLKGL